MNLTVRRTERCMLVLLYRFMAVMETGLCKDVMETGL